LGGCWPVGGKALGVIKGGHMTKLVIGLAAFVLLAAGGALAGGAITDSSSDDGVTTAGTTTDDETTTLDTTTATTTSTIGGVDISGPCDEAEHADDPRCTGVGRAVTRDGDDDAGEDRSGPGGDDDGHDDRSGSNSGRG
jgi:hypothetical protein